MSLAILVGAGLIVSFMLGLRAGGAAERDMTVQWFRHMPDVFAQSAASELERKTHVRVWKERSRERRGRR
jgi:hypothetical protein